MMNVDYATGMFNKKNTLANSMDHIVGYIWYFLLHRDSQPEHSGL